MREEEIIKDNIELLFKYSDNAFIGTRRYIKEHKKDKQISHMDLVYLTREALAELMKTDYLYDLRFID